MLSHNESGAAFRRIAEFILLILISLNADKTIAVEITREKINRINTYLGGLSGKSRPGLAVGVISGGDSIYSGHFGLANLEYGVPVGEETIFHVASVSKQVTAFAVLLLAEDGRIELDAEVKQYLPWIPNLLQPITVSDLIHHTSGLRDQWDLIQMAGWGMDDVITTGDIVRMMKRQQGLNFHPKTEFMYSNMGYTLLAEMVVQISGKTLRQFADERIFKPLGMIRSTFQDDYQTVIPNKAYSYSEDGRGIYKKQVLNMAVPGATNLLTTTGDMLLWLDNFRTQKVGSRETHKRMQQTVQPEMAQQITNFVPYAGGVIIGQYRGLTTIGHGGGDAGFRAHTLWFSEIETGIIAVSNFAAFQAAAVVHGVADIVVGDIFPEPKPVLPGTDQYTQTGIDNTCDTARFVGRYGLETGGLVEIARVGNSTRAKVPAVGNIDLVCKKDDVFAAPAMQATLEFRKRSEPDIYDIEIARFTRRMTARRVLSVPESSTVSSRLMGSFHSPELNVQIDITSEDDVLILKHPRLGDIALFADIGTGKNAPTEKLWGESPIFGEIKFRFDGNQMIDVLSISSFRARNIQFFRNR